MGTPSGDKHSGVGFRHCQVLVLGSDDYPAATDTSAYEGQTISGAKALTINDPEPRRITHAGDDSIFAMDVLPPTEAMSGELRTGKVNDDVDAVLTDTNQVTIGEAKFFGIGTDKRGDEKQVTLLAYRQALDTDPDSGEYGSRRWQFRLFPKAILVPREGSYDENPEEMIYTVTPQFINEYPWGVSFTTSTEGFTRAQGLRGVSQYKPKIVAFNGSGSDTTFAFPSAKAAASTSKVKVWVDGTLQEVTTDVTVNTTSLVFTTAPDADANIVAFYEHE